MFGVHDETYENMKYINKLTSKIINELDDLSDHGDIPEDAYVELYKMVEEIHKLSEK